MLRFIITKSDRLLFKVIEPVFGFNFGLLKQPIQSNVNDIFKKPLKMPLALKNNNYSFDSRVCTLPECNNLFLHI